MSRITRESFVATVGAETGLLDLKALGSRAGTILDRAGISPSALGEIVGDDGLVSGDEELSKLFDLLDSVDRNGNCDSIDTTRRGAGGRQIATASGALWDALQGEMETARLSRGSGGGRGGVTLTSTIASKTPLSNGGGIDATTAPTAAPTPPPNAGSRASEAEYSRAITSLEAQGFTDIHLAKHTPYFNQTDPTWAYHPYPKSPPVPGQTRTLKQSGCAPVALAMVDETLRGTGTTPIQVADFAVGGGFSGSSKTFGSDAQGMGKAWAAAHGLTFTAATGKDKSKNVDTLRDGIINGGVGVVGVGVDTRTGRGHFTDKGHIVVVNGYARDRNGGEWFFVVDPGHRDQSRTHNLGLDQTVVQDKSLHIGAGQLRISREQLEAEMRHAYLLER